MFGNSERRGNFSTRERERERRRYEDWPRKEKRNDFIYFFRMPVRI